MSHTTVKLHEIDLSVTPLHAAFKRTWTALCASTSIHGLKYTKDKDTNKIVRSTWIFIIFVSLIAAISMVITFYIRYRNNITRMTIENYIPVETLPFPAVTVCPEAMFNVAQSKRYLATLKFPPGSHNITQILLDLHIAYRFVNDDSSYTENPSTEQQQPKPQPLSSNHNVRPTMTFLNDDSSYAMSKSIEQLQNLIEYNNISIMTFMENLQWKCEDILYRCSFQSKDMDCKKNFARSKTAFGFCCSFNLNQDGLNYTGYRARASITEGLGLIVYYNDTDYGAMPTYSDGFKLLISQNDAFPGFDTPMKFVTLKRENFVNMRPNEIHTSESVKKLAITERKCVLPHEIPLKHFKNNVDVNCAIECRVNTTIKLCGCLPYFFDSSWTTDRICTFRDIPCLLGNFSVIVGRFREAQCNCSPNCNSLGFELEMTNTKLVVGLPVVHDFYKGIKKNYGVVNIFIDSRVFPRYKLDLIYNKLTLISNLGSAFSLFLGMSMVSVIEIIYYLTIILRKFYKQEVDMRKKLENLILIKSINRNQIVKS